MNYTWECILNFVNTMLIVVQEIYIYKKICIYWRNIFVSTMYWHCCTYSIQHTSYNNIPIYFMGWRRFKHFCWNQFKYIETRNMELRHFRFFVVYLLKIHFNIQSSIWYFDSHKKTDNDNHNYWCVHTQRDCQFLVRVLSFIWGLNGNILMYIRIL